MTDRIQEMRRQWEEEGRSLREIGKLHGVSGERVRQLIGNTGRRPSRSVRILRAERLAAYERITAGVSTLQEEAENLGLAHGYLRTYFISSLNRRLPPNSPKHGTWYRYQRGCRCDECKQAARNEHRKRVERGPKEHGTSSAYHNYGCRCEPCKVAGSKTNAEARQRRLKRERTEKRRRAEV